jgi:hypothetical protein
MVTVIGTEGLILGTTLYLLAGFFTLLMMPKWVGTVEPTLRKTWRQIVDDIIRRAYYCFALVAYWVCGAFLYNMADLLGVDFRWLFEMTTVMFDVIIAVMLIYTIMKIVADAIYLMKTAVMDSEYGRETQ